ncbi:9197_t:CDS:2 [Funneliformis caledonium]|uniref:9197_t:CDS:1 n=1 Tax=Funneliformis caledonium TaxID=1117310 RepID=A0A9N9CYK1_9GLOM|nr:9197_t:CDS:2 [Funneliformis caledonium]
MITFQLKTHISSRTSYLIPADYKDIMQYYDIKFKPLAQSTVTQYMNVIDKQNEEQVLS